MHASAARSQRGLSLDETLQLKWALGAALALLSVWSVFFFDLSGVALLPFVSTAILATAWRPAWAERIPALAWTLAFPALLLFVAADYFLGRELLATLIRLNVLLVTVRAIGPRKRREDLQLVVLCLFLLVVAGVLTVSLGFAVVILAFAALGLVFLLLVTLSDAALAGQPPPAHWTDVAWPVLARRLGHVLDWRFAGFAAGLFLGVVALASLLFLALPRFKLENAVGLLNLQNRKSFTGFSETVSLGDVTDITEDTTTAVRLETSQPDRAPTQAYWRMVALDAYENGVFRVSRGAARFDRFEPTERWELTGSALPGADARTPTWTVYLEPGVTRYLPLAGPFERLRVTDRQPLVTNALTRVVALRNEPQKLFAYRVEGMAETDRLHDPLLPGLFARTADRALPARLRGPGSYPQTLLSRPAAPADEAVLAAQVREITGGATLAAGEFAARAMTHLAKRHRYAMRSALPPGDGDPFVRWLNSDTPGHCELFAGGFALLARQAGFPTRLVTGFRGGVWNDFEGYLMLRNADAHAWCEIFDATRSEWRRVDATPSAGGAAGSLEAALAGARRTDRSWSARVDSLRLLWYRRIVNFDSGAQAETVESLRTYGKRTLESAVATVEALRLQFRDWWQQPWSGERTQQSLALLALGWTLVWLAWRWRTRWRWNRSERRGRLDPIRREAGRWLARFAAAPPDAIAPETTRDLQRLRYGPPGGDVTASRVFAAARREWRHRNRKRRERV